MFLLRLSPQSDTYANDSDRIVLDVGGALFHTTKRTLCARADTYLSRMVQFKASNWQAATNGSLLYNNLNLPVFFIDRDPAHFDRILTYLRTGKFLADLSLDSYALNVVKMEAEFYELPELVNAVQMYALSHANLLRNANQMADSLIDRRQRTNTSLEPRKQAVIRVFYKDQEKGTLAIEPFPVPYIDLDVNVLAKAFNESMETTVNVLTQAGYRIEKMYWDESHRFKSFVVMSYSTQS
ncbi:protein homooligomerization [Sorochytrium milnesiophthora]